MGISLSEASKLLLEGKKLAWKKYKDHKPGSITLEAAGQRRLFEFLLAAEPAKVAAVDETLFAGIVAAWENKSYDPATKQTTKASSTAHSSWRLDRIEASGFGGLTTFGGKPFDLYIGGHNWCLEGQNGSGKTSLVSAVLWALTGRRIREHEGPVEDRGQREAVKDADGRTLGHWPPLAAYPSEITDLGKQAEVWVRLTFKAADGEIATAFRQLVSPPTGEASINEKIDDRLDAATRVAEIGVLMPARLTKIGFGKNSVSLYEAVKQLTGLDQLSDIADGCSAFSAGNRKFMKYAKDHGIDNFENRFSDSISSAKKLAEEFEFEVSDAALEDSGACQLLTDNAKQASTSAGEHLKTLENEISTNIDMATSEGRTAIKSAVVDTRGILNQGSKAITIFKIGKALVDAASDTNFAALPNALKSADQELRDALEWHDRQTKDAKLRLKALASQSFTPSVDSDADCPLCMSPLDDEPKRALALELEELKLNAESAERKIADACRSIQASVNSWMPATIRDLRSSIDTFNPASLYATTMQETFVTSKPFSDILIGISSFAKETVEGQKSSLPAFTYSEPTEDGHDSESVSALRRELHAIERIVSLVDWWKSAHTKFDDAWTALIGKKLEDGTYPPDCVEGKLSALEQALGRARPLDELSKHLTNAASFAKSWGDINSVQKQREAIKEAIEPLKLLKTLVASETSSSIARLSETINTICSRINLSEKLSYEEANIGKKEVSVLGSFTPGMRIDAALVANTSWLRAILWSFVFALREETLVSLGHNPMPLIILDDPQATFDPRNKRRWAQELVRGANLPINELLGSQLIVTTHERNFYQMMIDHEKFHAQQGLVGGVNKVSGVATIANGGELQRLYDEAKSNNDDAKAREYIRKVRIYCEDLIKFMLRSINNEIQNQTLGQLREELKRLHKSHVPPFDRKAFDALIGSLNESQKAIQYINDPHHKDDETFGVAEADCVKEFWDRTLLDKIHTAFGVFDTFELYTGEPRTFPWAKNIVAFPEGHKDRVKVSAVQHTGIAAAAKTDGRAGDGILTVEEWESGKKIVLPNHEIFQLAAGTLDPVATIGDVIIVSNYARIHARNLVTAVSGGSLLARRFNRPENHSEIVVLTGQAVDPSTLPEPVIVQPDTDFRKIVGTLFVSHLLPTPPIDPTREFISVDDPSILDKTLNGARLFQVEGRSAEPVALEGQFLITRGDTIISDNISSLDGRLVVAIDEDGARYFKRLRCHKQFVVLESLNPDGQTAAEVLSLDDTLPMPKISEALEVIGVLFELPDAKP